MITPRRIAILFALLSLFAPLVHSQSVVTGTPPFGNFGGGPDIIDLANLNAHLTIPVLQKAGRGIPFTYNITYDSSIWQPVGASGSQVWEPTNSGAFGWSYSAMGNMVITGGEVLGYCYTWVGPPINQYYVTGEYGGTNYAYQDNLGTLHRFSGYEESSGGTCGSGYVNDLGPVTDGSGYSPSVDSSGNFTVKDRNGKLVYWTNSNKNLVTPYATDTNGNQITMNSSNQFFDTLSSSTPVLAVAGTAPNPTKFTYTAPSGGGNKSYTMNYTNYTVATNFGISNITEYKSSGPVPLVTSIELPDGSQYTFTYEATPSTPASGACTPYAGTTCTTARLASVTLPTGGEISYAYFNGNNGILSDGSTAALTRTTPDGAWTYAHSESGTAWTTNQTDPQGNKTVMYFQGIYPTETEAYQGTSTLLKTAYTCYNGASAPCNSTAITLPITQTTVYPQWANEQEAETNKIYNSAGLVTEEDDYDYGNGAPGSLLRKITTNLNNFGEPSQAAVYNGSGTLMAQTLYGYDEVAVVSSGITTQHVSVSCPCGNLTSVSQWLNTNDSWLISKNTYFDTGMVDVATDAKGNPTTHAYSSTYAGAYPTTVTNALNQQTNYTYDPNSGQVTSVEDANQRTTSYTYDSLLRPLTVSYPDGGQMNYSHAAEYTGSYTGIDQKKDTSGDWSQSYVWFDPLGRPARAVTPSGESSPWNEVGDTCYNGDGLASFTSYPYQDGGWSGPPPCNTAGDSYTYDALGRVTKVTHSDGSAINASYSSPPCATVTDEQGKTREMCSDGLGRLTEVIENPGGLNYTTNYTYDALGNVTGVTQSGSRNRTSVYDSLSRLTSSTNPESGTTTYTYDADGNLATKTDARNITATYTYDALNRVTQKTYSDGTPSAFFYYDANNAWGYTETNMVGRLTEEWTGTSCCATGGAEVFSYDPMGRVIDDYQWQPSATFTIPYTYDLLGDVTSYGSGTGAEIFTQSINAAGLPTQVTASWSDANHPATLVSNVHYNAAGNVISGTFGNSLTETFAYNGRLQPCRSNLNSSGTVLSTCGDSVPSGNYLDISAGYGSQDNGNVTSWSATGAQIFNRSYTYDAVNRLSTMSAPGDQCTGLTWTYDAWGNRTDQTATGGTCDTFHQSVNGSNQFASGYSYDADGNMIYDGVHNYFYDAEDRLIQVDGTKGNCSTATACYLYDAQGRRTQKIYGSNNMGYTYDLSGRVSSEWCQPCGTYNGWAGGYVFLAGRMFAQYTDGTVLFTQTDHLRSTRLLTGYPTPGVSACYDYYPFGEIISCGATGDQPQKFTGYLRDGETNLDDANARYFASSLGRFMSPDPSGLYFADPTDPQQLNLYSYVRNSSLEFLDPFGLTTCDANGNNCQDTVTVNGGDGCDLLCQLWLNLYGQLVSSAGSLSPPGPYAFLGGGGGGGGAGPQSPCTNATLAAAGVNAQEQIGMAQGLIAAGKAGAGASQFSNPVFGFFGGMFGYYEAVKTGGPNDIKDQPGPGYHNQTGVDAGNISFGVTCPYGAGFCQFAAGLAQTLSGNPNFNGTLTTGFDTPSDNAGIRTGQAMRAAGCHE